MRYVNTKTGAVIDSSFTISGGDWIAEKETLKQAEIEKEKVVEHEKEEKFVQQPLEENKADFEGITRPQIMQELDAFGIEYDKRANKQTLYDLMMSQGK
ncbi:MAG TPA: hypothetical protein DIW21_04885 [Enterococcus sp.]|nr:hypothetical protein [Enterococcus sp.]